MRVCLDWAFLFLGWFMKTNEIKFREDLYPRFEPNQQAIERYSNSIEYLPPIIINHNNILIDGFHRWKAHQLAKQDEIKVEIIETASEQEVKKLAYKLNSIHGLQLTDDEKKKFAREMFGLMTEQEIADTISVSQRSVYNWTKTQRENAKAEQERQILDIYLRAWNTQESIAKEFKISQKNVSDILSKFCTDAKNTKEFKPFLYNIWNTPKGNETDHFGSFPLIFMKNLLHYHTNQMDIIYDPFAGAGTTIDACKNMLRRYCCYDLIVKPGREKDILQWDITQGLPDMPKPDFVFLDPPYWKQAKGKYSENENDFGNMDLDSFIFEMAKLIDFLCDWDIQRIAFVISPTQYSNDDKKFVNHYKDIIEMFPKKYDEEMLYELPYSTEQYNGTQVNVMKKENKVISLTRLLSVWMKNGI